MAKPSLALIALLALACCQCGMAKLENNIVTTCALPEWLMGVGSWVQLRCCPGVLLLAAAGAGCGASAVGGITARCLPAAVAPLAYPLLLRASHYHRAE
jgi:hypothetical protein